LWLAFTVYFVLNLILA